MGMTMLNILEIKYGIVNKISAKEALINYKQTRTGTIQQEQANNNNTGSSYQIIQYICQCQQH